MANCNSCGRYVYATDAHPAGTVRCEIDDVCPAYVKPFPRRWADDPEELAAAQRQLENETLRALAFRPNETAKPQTVTPETTNETAKPKSETAKPSLSVSGETDKSPETTKAKRGRRSDKVYPDNAARLRAWRLRRRGG